MLWERWLPWKAGLYFLEVTSPRGCSFLDRWTYIWQSSDTYHTSPYIFLCSLLLLATSNSWLLVLSSSTCLYVILPVHHDVTRLFLFLTLHSLAYTLFLFSTPTHCHMQVHLSGKLHPRGDVTSKKYKPTFHGSHLSHNMSYGGAATLWVFCLPWWRYSYSTRSFMMELILSVSQHWNFCSG